MFCSRIHPLKFISKPHSAIYIKRDDELGFGISGTKLRKYESLLVHIKQQSIKHAVLIGGAYSNNIVGLTQLLIEQDVVPYLFLRGDQAPLYKGNFLLISLLVPAEQIYWVKRADWEQVTTGAQAFLQSLPTNASLLIPEGACMVEALPGALTLGEDIVKNEYEHDLLFDHIFIEAGTGLAAIGLILSLAIIKRRAHIHILLLALTKDEFLEKLRVFYQHLSQGSNQQITWEELIHSLHFYTPAIAPSFGATNQTIFETIIQVARQDGILTDPIYTAKLLLTAKQIILDTSVIIGNILIIHGGGGLGLMGYQEQLEKQLRKNR
jgi:1-aminocyclopropane-1-carboxylate deaminase/D-cysteine desulfhydrase-like pyridoxal-dependent ACC family enzyme